MSSDEYQKQYENLRATSAALSSYRRSGQGNPNFFPDFCEDNPVHVYLHYIMRDDKEKTGSDDLSIAAFSLIDPKKHVNSMFMPAGSTTSTRMCDYDEDMPSSDNQPAGVNRESLYRRLDRALNNVIQAKRLGEITPLHTCGTMIDPQNTDSG